MEEGTNEGDVCESVGSTGACDTSIGSATQSANLTMSTEGGSAVVPTPELEEEDGSQDASEEARVIASIVDRVAACDFSADVSCRTDKLDNWQCRRSVDVGAEA